MQKIPTLFVRDPEDRRHLLPDVTPGCEWVLAGEGNATRKWDGTCVRLDTSGSWWARREVKPGKTPPPNFQLISTDPATGKSVGWEPVAESPFAKFHGEALANGHTAGPGTYELVGPKINGNPENYENHTLMPHGLDQLSAPSDFEGLREWLHAHSYEGIVWHHPDGRMVKLKARDFPS